MQPIEYVFAIGGYVLSVILFFSGWLIGNRGTKRLKADLPKIVYEASLKAARDADSTASEDRIKHIAQTASATVIRTYMGDGPIKVGGGAKYKWSGSVGIASDWDDSEDPSWVYYPGKKRKKKWWLAWKKKENKHDPPTAGDE